MTYCGFLLAPYGKGMPLLCCSIVVDESGHAQRSGEIDLDGVIQSVMLTVGEVLCAGLLLFGMPAWTRAAL